MPPGRRGPRPREDLHHEGLKLGSLCVDPNIKVTYSHTGPLSIHCAPAYSRTPTVRKGRVEGPDDESRPVLELRLLTAEEVRHRKCREKGPENRVGLGVAHVLTVQIRGVHRRSARLPSWKRACRGRPFSVASS